MYYGDYEEGEFFAEDLDFKDEKNRGSNATTADIISGSIISSQDNNNSFNNNKDNNNDDD